MPANNELNVQTYDAVRDEIQTGDVLLYRGKSLISRAIRMIGRTPYSHAGMAGWINGTEHARLFAYEMHMFAGGTATHLRAHAKLWPRQIDVYHVSDMHVEFKFLNASRTLQGYPQSYDRRAAMAQMADFCEPGVYGWSHLWWIALLNLPVVRWFAKRSTGDQLHDGEHPPFCSEAVAFAIKQSFTDVVPNTPDHFTHPADLARSPLLHYKFTLDSPAYAEPNKL